MTELDLDICAGVGDQPCYLPAGHDDDWHAHWHPDTGFVEWRVVDGIAHFRTSYLGQPIEGEHPMTTTITPPKRTRLERFDRAYSRLAIYLTLVFLALAVTGVINWPWWLLTILVLVPLGFSALMLALALVALTIGGIAWLVKQRASRA